MSKTRMLVLTSVKRNPLDSLWDLETAPFRTGELGILLDTSECPLRAWKEYRGILKFFVPVGGNLSHTIERRRERKSRKGIPILVT